MDEGLSQSEAHILGFLASEPDGSMNDLHRHFGHRRSTLTNIVDRLEARDLVRRQQNPTSRRSVNLVLTERGRLAAQEVHELLTWVDQSVTDRVDMRDIAGFEAVLKALQEATT